jgi:hypothetical protein
MAVGYLEINIGTTANDGTGDSIRNSFSKINDNYTGIFTHRSINAVSPTGLLTPSWLGEEIMTTMSGNAWWKSVSATSPTGWLLISNFGFGTEDWGTIP